MQVNVKEGGHGIYILRKRQVIYNPWNTEMMLRNKERLQHVRKSVSLQNPLYSETLQILTRTPAPDHQENWPVIFTK